MDQGLIGKFIAQERKRKGCTQRQLAEELGISDKTISKWETGRGIPEISLLLPLCQALDLTVNELLTGSRLTAEEYREKAEENMVTILHEKEENRKNVRLTNLVGVMSTVAFVVLILVVSLFTQSIPLEAKSILIAVAIGVFAVGIYVAMQGERTIGYYRCTHCGDYFTPTFGAYMWAPHIFSTRRLRCPHCGQKSWAKKVMSKDEPSEPPT